MRAITRVNRLGLEFRITELDTNKTSIQLSGKDAIIVGANIRQIDQGWYDWAYADKLIQDAFPFLSSDEREYLITGMTKEEWDKIFSKGDE